jgi:hypothetical protein
VPGTQTLAIGRGDAHDGALELEGHVLERLGDDGDPRDLIARRAVERHLLEVVDHDHRGLVGLLPHLRQHPGHLGGGRVARRLVEVQPWCVVDHGREGVGAVRDAGERLGEAAAVGVGRLEDGPDGMDVRGCRRVLAGLDGKARRLEGDEALDEGSCLVLEGEDHRVAAGAHRVAHHLERDRRLARPLAAPEQDQFAGAQAAVERGVEQVEPGGPDRGPGSRSSAQRRVGLVEQVLHRAAAVDVAGATGGRGSGIRAVAHGGHDTTDARLRMTFRRATS